MRDNSRVDNQDCRSVPIVNSWNEWDPLRRVIVGKADGAFIPPPEPALECKVPLDSDMKGTWGQRSAESIAAANEQLNGFAEILRRRGIVVDRPTPIDFGKGIQTPDFSVNSMFDCMAPRDVLATVGHELLEA